MGVYFLSEISTKHIKKKKRVLNLFFVSLLKNKNIVQKITKMKLLYTIATLSAGFAVADICNDVCSAEFCDDSDANLQNWDKAGFDSPKECQKHACSAKFENSPAEWHVCEAGAAELEGRKYNHIVKMVKQVLTEAGKTSLSLRQLFRQIQNYGCHCFPGGEQLAGGVGVPVDAQDSACRTLARCHKCVSMDHDISSSSKYRYHFKNGELSCDRNLELGSQANYDLCQCDAEFARSLAAFWDDSTFNNFYWLKPQQMKKPVEKRDPEHQSKFDYQATCVAFEVSKADSCCGSYPKRYPFDSASTVQCCKATNLFNSAIAECCDDGSVVKPGEC